MIKAYKEPLLVDYTTPKGYTKCSGHICVDKGWQIYICDSEPTEMRVGGVLWEKGNVFPPRYGQWFWRSGQLILGSPTLGFIVETFYDEG